MTTVFVLGEKNDTTFRRLILDGLSRTYKIFYAFDGSFIEAGMGYELLFIEMDNPTEIVCSDCIVLLKSETALPCATFPENAIVIANSQNIKQMELLKNHKGNVITCGLGKKDTFSCTSNTEESLVISLNRSITALSGRKIEPLEIPLQQGDEDIYYDIAFVALKAVLDDFNSEIGRLY
ncbi:MAG: hypothetical protein ACI4J1_08950 [Ruminiclostridium sp.]